MSDILITFDLEFAKSVLAEGQSASHQYLKNLIARAKSTCAKCAGTGHVIKVFTGKPCPDCQGTGDKPDEDKLSEKYSIKEA